MSTLLTPEYFVNPRYPPGVVPGGVAVASEEVERSSTVGTKVGDNPDSLSRVADEMEEPDASGES